MDMALRPRANPFSMSSRNGSLTLAAVAGGVAPFVSDGGKRPAAGGGSAVTSLAGFAVGGSVVTPLAGFGGAFLPHPPGGRKPMPAALKYPAAVSRRMPVAFSICRSDQPSWPNAMTCFFFSSFKTLLTSKEGTLPRRIQCPDLLSIGRFCGDHYWPVLGDR